MRLNIRCCCQPTKILGTLDVQCPEHPFFQVAVMPEMLHPWWEMPKDAIIPSADIVAIQIRSYGPDCERAIYSEERPVEFWRKIRGFEEA